MARGVYLQPLAAYLQNLGPTIETTLISQLQALGSIWPTENATLRLSLML